MKEQQRHIYLDEAIEAAGFGHLNNMTQRYRISPTPLVSLNNLLPDDTHEYQIGLPLNDPAFADKISHQDEIKHYFQAADLTDREMCVMVLKYMRGWTFKDISRRSGWSLTCISKDAKIAIRKIQEFAEEVSK